MKRAWTLVELVCVVAIIVTLAAITYPVFARARFAAKIASSTNKLRQLYVATKLYQADHNEDTFGTLEQMGLPDAYFVMTNRFGLQEDMIMSSCGAHWSAQPAPGADVHNFIYFPGDGAPPFPEQARTWRDNLVMFFDQHCNPPSVDLRNRFHTKFGLGILFGGNTVRVHRKGDLFKPEFWSRPMD